MIAALRLNIRCEFIKIYMFKKNYTGHKQSAQICYLRKIVFQNPQQNPIYFIRIVVPVCLRNSCFISPDEELYLILTLSVPFAHMRFPLYVHLSPPPLSRCFSQLQRRSSSRSFSIPLHSFFFRLLSHAVPFVA